jgi:ATP-binding cassette subfamily F protein 3
LVQLQGIRYSVGPRTLFEELDWVIAPGDRSALVGPNGTGKTTLIRVALGELVPDRGTRVVARGTRLGYLPQEAAERFAGTVLGRALEAHRHVLEARQELDALHARLAESSAEDPHLEALLARAGELQHRLDLQDEHALEPEARRVLSGLGFARADQDRPLAEFSGGWRMRAALAALLLTDPTVLFLDEPTNHLDLPAMEWLEDYLESFAGALVVVSHDRIFLDRVVTEVRELEATQLHDYPAPFTRYLEEKEARREQTEARNAQLDQKISQLSRFVERFGAKNTKAAQAQSKRKQIERLRREKVILPRRSKGIHFHFPTPPHAGRTLLKLHDLGFGYDRHDVIAGAQVEIQRGDKVAIVGANGAGKTTLLRLMAGQLAPRTGTRDLSPLTRMAYFAQHAAETLDPGHTALGALETEAPPEWRPRLRSLLGTFLFTGDDVYKLCRILSGGERQRVALARILMHPANLLLLDEPTHHLDIMGKEVLEDALEQYPGAVVVVTHDRSLMGRLATRVLEVRDGHVMSYPGGYDDYEAARLGPVPGPAAVTPQARDGSTPGAAPKAGGAATRTHKATVRPAPAAAREGAGRAARAPNPARRGREIERVERDIQERERRIAELEARLADPQVYHDGEQARALVSDYERLRAELESLWQRLAEL